MNTVVRTVPMQRPIYFVSWQLYRVGQKNLTIFKLQQNEKYTIFLPEFIIKLSSSQNIFINIIFLHGVGRLTCSGIDALPLFPGASTFYSSSRFVVEGVFRQSGVVRSFKVVDRVMSIFESHVLYSRDLQFFPYDFASYFIQPCVSRNTS